MAPPSENIRRAAVGAQNRIKGFPTELDTAMQFVKWTAESLEGAHDEEKVATLRAATRDMAGLHETLRLHIMALSEVENGRLAQSEDQTFTDILHSRTMEMAAQDPRAPEEHEAFKAFNKAVWVINHGDEPMPGEEEEDIVMTSRDLVANAHCPLSMKAVEELTEPVCASECRHIYEAADARAYFRSRGRGCAVAGCNKDVTVSSLISDSKLLRDLQELKRNKRGGRSTQHEEEYTALDEEED